ncbi:MAG: hypothetical protein JNK85_01170 [Verrucomicrobiales bacterium]|nr:hypothetical protein [Verrucomicrobiales bacterium]
MVPNPDDEVQRLLRLLAVKRHETPPPGFFDSLPNRILVSIRAGTEMSDRGFWERLWIRILREPMVAGSYAALGLGAMVFGVSVFQMAIEHESHTGIGMEELATTTPGMLLAPPNHLPGGIIYRVSPADYARSDDSYSAPSPSAYRVVDPFRTSVNGVEVQPVSLDR